MKQIKISTILCSFLFVGLTSCLKEGKMTTPPGQTSSVVGFGNTGDNVAASSSTYPGFYADLGSLASGASTTFNINVQYDGASDAPSDITVNLTLDPSLLDKYNTENGTGYVVPPSDVFAMPSSLIIKKGTRTAQGQIKITNNNSFDFNEAYALPVTISSTSNNAPVSSNFGKAVYSFGVRNVYDGHYTVTANSPMVDAAAGSLTGAYPMDVDLVTVGANSVVMVDNAIGVPSHSIHSGSSLSYYGSYAPVLNFDPSGNGTIASVTNYYGQPSGNGRSAEMDPSGVNKRSANNDIQVKYWMNQPAVITPHRVYFDETFTYLGPR